MVSHDEIEARLIAEAGVSYAHVLGDGYHYELTVVSDQFEGLRPVARQQWVYSKLKDYIASGELHALTMKTWTEAEWEKTRE
ncbi:MAG: BolA/IbaG family iron-sulfur metabolism protein [Legionellaceae bacterium]|nr:BolA/IbaG family iron-sulfur metabolism protein [Legionellaceae bacterium]